jgi:hypothetical protein
LVTNGHYWEIKIRESKIKAVDFVYDDQNSIALQKGFDYNHINITSLRFDAENSVIALLVFLEISIHYNLKSKVD